MYLLYGHADFRFDLEFLPVLTRVNTGRPRTMSGFASNLRSLPIECGCKEDSNVEDGVVTEAGSSNFESNNLKNKIMFSKTFY